MSLEVRVPAKRFPTLPPQASRAAEAVARLRPRAGRGILFLAAVLLPTLVATFYYGLVASDRFVSEAQFVVRGVASRRATGLEMFFQTFGIARTVDDANAVQNYMLSRDAVRALEERLPLRRMFARQGADVFSRFPRFWRGDTFERLYDYYLDRVTVTQEAAKGIAVLRVEAFDPQDAQKIASELLRLGELFVNRMNARAQNDAVRSAVADLALAEKRIMDAQKELTEFRMKEGLIDPSKDSASTMSTITQLSTEMALAITQIGETAQTSPSSPAIPALRAKVNSLRDRIQTERQKLAGADSTLASKLSVYEQLSLARALAERSLAGASASLDTARQEARRQAIYLEEIVQPNLSDDSTEPQRLRMIATVFVLSLALASIAWLLTAGAREHAIE